MAIRLWLSEMRAMAAMVVSCSFDVVAGSFPETRAVRGEVKQPPCHMPDHGSGRFRGPRRPLHRGSLFPYLATTFPAVPPPLHNRNTARRPLATALPWAALAALVLGPLAAAQPADPQPAVPAIVARPAAAAVTPSPARTLAAYALVESWVRAGAVPAEPPRADLEALRDTDLPGDAPLTGAAVQLRLAGRLIGRGSDMGGGPTSLWHAAREAWAEAAPRLPRTAGAGLEAEAVARETLRQVMISVELAGPPILIIPTPATHEDVSLALAPGLDGVAVRFGAADPGREAQTAAIFPGQMLVANMLPGAALAAAASRAGGSATLGLVPPKELVEKHGAVLMRFRVSHVAQTGPGAPPEFLDRGGRIIRTADMTAAHLRTTADRLAHHIAARLTGPDGGAAAYDPWRDAPGDAALTAADRALAAAALSAYSRLPHAGPDQIFALSVAREIEADLTQMRATRPLPAPEAAIVAALTVGIHDGAAPDAADLLRAVYSEEAGFAPQLPPAARAVVAYGLANLAARPNAPDDLRALASSAVRAIFRETPTGQLVAQMPWLGWAEVMLADAQASGGDAAADIPAAIALRRMREQVWEHMITATDAAADEQDMIGAIIFTRSSRPVPTWQAARPLAFIASMLADNRLTDPGEVNTELVRLLTALRFLRQLQADDTSMWLYPSRDRALGGIRDSLWNQRMPLEASALTLLAVTETLNALDRRAAAQTPAPSQP